MAFQQRIQIPVPATYLWRLGGISTAIVFPLIVARLLVPAFYVQSKLTGFILDFIVALLWILGVAALTRPINNPEAIRYGVVTEGKFRRIARWCAYGGIGVVIFVHAPRSLFLTPLLLGSIAVATTGLICLFIFLSEIATWVRDRSAKKFLETAAWGIPLLLLIALGLYFVSIPLLSAVVMIWVVLLTIGGILGMLMLASSVIRAVKHAREYEDYQERRIHKKESTQFPSPE